MAEETSSQTSLDSISRSQSDDSLASHRSSIHSLYGSSRTRRRNVLFRKLEEGYQTVLRRFSTKYKTLSDLEIQILATITHFDRDAILDWHQKFLLDCPHGYMTRKQFIATYVALFPNGDVERFASHIFRAFDLDKSNTVDFREFLIGLYMTSSTSAPEIKLQWLFQVFDIDGNGLLTRSECLEVIDTIVRFNYSQQTERDTMNINELIRSAKRSMMRIFDDLSDGRCNALTVTQFIQGCLNDELISQLLASMSTVGNDPLSSRNPCEMSTIAE